jgi:hypothetical protein
MLDTTDFQPQAEALRLAAGLDDLRDVDYDDLFIRSAIELRRQHAEIERLQARVAELGRDAARLDAIERNARCDPKMCGNHVWWPTTWKHQLVGPTLRAAIDAAISKEQP